MVDDEEVGTKPITMRRVPACGTRREHVVSVFGKSTYVEPVLSVKSVKGLKALKSVMPDVWTIVDATTMPIMSRAVIMC